MDFTVLECKRYIAPSASTVIKRIVTDYEIDFHIKGGREITINNRTYHINAGDISIRKPGEEVYSFGDYDCYILTIDFSCGKNALTYSRNAENIMQNICCDSIISDLGSIITPFSVKEYKDFFEKLSKQTDYNSEYSKNVVRCILHQMNIDHMRKQTDITEENISAVNMAYRYIHENFLKQIKLDDVAGYVHMDKSYLTRRFKKHFGTSPVNYLIGLRQDYARSLLINTDMSITNVALHSGYNNISFFISQFKKIYGLTPQQYRKRMWVNDL